MDEKRMIIRPYKEREELNELLRRSVASWAALSPEEKARHHRAQAISWVYGNLALDGCDITREQVEKHFDELYGKLP